MSTKILQYPRYKSLFFIALFTSIIFWGSLLGWLWFKLPQWLAAWTTLEEHVRSTLLPPIVFTAVFAAQLLNTLMRIRHLSMLRGFAVMLTEKQQPDLYSRLHKVCARLDIETPPTAYVCGHNQLLKSVHVFGKDHLALDGDIISALTERQGAIEFHMGQQLAKLRDPYNPWYFLLAPALVLPLLGSAWRRAQIYQYDRAGLSACKTKVDAALGLAVEVTRSDRWKSVNIPEFAKQSQDAALFWMSANELVSAEPWPSKRMAHLRALATSSDTFIPRRHLLAWLFIAPLPYIKLSGPAGILHTAGLVLWLVPMLYWGQLLLPRLSQYLPTTANMLTQSPESAAGNQTENTKAEQANNPYKGIDADLGALGTLARNRVTKSNLIPCDGGELGDIKLNYAPARYAYSCDQSVVYTRISHGEFVPGKRAHVRRYDWKKMETIPEKGKKKPANTGK